MPERSFLTQRFAKINFGQLTVIGYSVAGEESVVQIPELDVTFDVGRAPHFALTSNILCITHGHMDHIAGLPYYLSQRHFQGMKTPTVLLPRELAEPVDVMLRCWRDVEKQATPYKLQPISASETFPVRKDFAIRAVETHHGGTSLGYVLISVREKLKPEYRQLTGPQIATLRKQGVEVQYRVEIPLVAYLGDTTAGKVFQNPDVVNAEILITETTFFDKNHKARAKHGKHLHLDSLLQILPTLKNKHLILTHVSRRTGIGAAKRMLRRQIGDAAMQNVSFLMDFENAADAGDFDQTLPPAQDTPD